MSIRIYHMLPAKYGLDALRNRRLKIARIQELNDPFEFLGFDLGEPNHRRSIEQTKRQLAEARGLLCFSKGWDNPLLWSHYADRHRGVCLGCDVSEDMFWPVEYVDSRPAIPAAVDQNVTRQLLFTKFTHWQYEQEYRAFVSLNTQERGLYFISFGDAVRLAEVTIGAESSVSAGDVRAALGSDGATVSLFKARPADRVFRMTRNRITSAA